MLGRLLRWLEFIRWEGSGGLDWMKRSNATTLGMLFMAGTVLCCLEAKRAWGVASRMKERAGLALDFPRCRWKFEDETIGCHDRLGCHEGVEGTLGDHRSWNAQSGCMLPRTVGKCWEETLGDDECWEAPHG